MKNIDELKIPAEVYIKDYDVNVRPYLLVEDIYNIGNMMLACEDLQAQKLVLMINVLRQCTDIPEEYLTLPTEDDEAEEPNDKFMGFDTMILTGLWKAVEEQVFNVDEVWEYVGDAEAINKIVGRFLEGTVADALGEFNHTIDKFQKKMPKSTQWEKIVADLPNQLKEVIDLTSNSENSEILKGAMGLNK